MLKGRQRKRHCHPMVLIRLNRRRLQLRRRMHHQPILAHLHRGPKLLNLSRHGRNAIGLLHPPRPNVSQLCGPLCIERHWHQGHGCIGNVIAVQIDAHQTLWPCRGLNEVFAPANPRPHLLQCVCKSNIALQAVTPHAQDTHWAPTQNTSRQKVRGRRGIAFNHQLTGAHQTALHFKHARRGLGNLHRKPLEQCQSKVDIRPADQLTFGPHNNH